MQPCGVHSHPAGQAGEQSGTHIDPWQAKPGEQGGLHMMLAPPTVPHCRRDLHPMSSTHAERMSRIAGQTKRDEVRTEAPMLSPRASRC